LFPLSLLYPHFTRRCVCMQYGGYGVVCDGGYLFFSFSLSVSCSECFKMGWLSLFSNYLTALLSFVFVMHMRPSLVVI
jgi:hypothetical protein